MNIIAYKPFQSLKTWRFVTGWTLDLYRRVRHEGEVADRCLASFLRRNPQIGSRNRRALGDLLFTTLRWDLACDAFADRGFLNEACSDPFRIAGGLTLAMGPEAPSPAELAQGLDLSPEAEKGLIDLAQRQQMDPDPIWTTGLSAYLSTSLTETLGERSFQRLAASLLETGPVWLRARVPDQTQQLVESLQRHSIEAESFAALPGALRLPKRGPLQKLKAFRKGHFWVQDLGSQLISHLVAPEPSHRVLDACAGAGGKSLCLLSAHPDLNLSAWDVDSRRLENCKTRLKRSGFRSIPIHSIAQQGKLPAKPGSFDRVLIDAPCSGSGTLAAHPEGRRRITRDRVASEAQRQTKILRRFAPLIRPGGRLIYATCSMLAAENEDRVTNFLEEHPEFHLVPAKGVLGEDLSEHLGQEDFLRLWPHLHGTDGFFAAILQRR